MFDAGAILLALHAQLILQPLDSLRLVAARLQHVVLYTCQLLTQGSILLLYGLQLTADLTVPRLVLLGCRQSGYFFL